MKFLLKTATMLASAALLFSACDDMDSIHEKYYSDSLHVYLSIPEIIDIYPGYERARVYWTVDADVRLENTVIYWTYDEVVDSVVIPITTRDTMWVELELPESNYVIEMKNIGPEGSSSLTAEMPVTVYGDTYISLMSDRPVASTEYDDETGFTTINWGSTDDLISQTLTYTTDKGESVDIYIDASEDVTVLEDAEVGSPYSYTTTYLFEDALDYLTTFPTTGLVLPIHSVLIDKSNYTQSVGLQGDADAVNAFYTVAQLWDGTTTDMGFTSATYADRKTISLDLGAEYRLGSIKIWQPYANCYCGSSIKIFALYGCTTDPTLESSTDTYALYTIEDYTYEDGAELMDVVFPDLTYWTTVLASANVDQPSGLGAGSTDGSLDEEAAYAGHEFQISSNVPAVRYLRLQLIDSWEYENGKFSITEIEVYGSLVD